MADLYTSFSTSLALRDAGAPQDGRFVRRANGDVIEAWGSRLAEHAPEHFVACFRADEIVEALDPMGTVEVEFLHGRVVIWPWNRPCVSGPSLVETVAAAWLAVLKDVKRG